MQTGEGAAAGEIDAEALEAAAVFRVRRDTRWAGAQFIWVTSLVLVQKYRY
jgi:hypothetical protein